MRKTHKISISRSHGEGEMSLEHWKDLISALVLAGYEVGVEDDCVTFTLGWDDLIEEVEK